MNPPLKKLAVLFLIGATLTSSLTFAVSAFMNREAAKSADSQPSALVSSEGYRIYGAGPNGKNISEELTSLFARQLVEANPEGPKTNPDGSVQLVAPPNDDLFAYLETNPASEDVLTPPVDDSRIQVVQDFDDTDVSHYLSEISQIQSGLTSSPIWQAGLSNINADATTADAAASMSWTYEADKVFAAARDKAYAMKVPAPFVQLHKSELAFFSTMSSFSSMVIQDPVAAITLSENLDQIVAKQSDDMKQAAKDIQANFPELMSVLPHEASSLLSEILMIPTAHATFPVLTVDGVINWATKFWNDYKDIIKSTALGTLKNALMQKIGQKVIEWSKGNPDVPGYVTNWFMFEADAVLSSKFGLIKNETAKVCGNAATSGLYGDILASALGVSTQNLGITGSRTVGDTPGCPSVSSGFYADDGTNAGYFLDTLTHNTWNDLLDVRDDSIKAAAQASQAAVNEALAGRGSLDVKKCDDGSTPGANGTTTEQDLDPNFVGPVVPAKIRCADGSAAQTVTPGAAKQELVSKALGGVSDIIAGVNNEKTIGAIVQVVTNVVVTSALKKAEGIYSDSHSNHANSPPPGSSSFASQISWYADQLENALALAQGAVTNSGQAKETFQAILDGGSCAQTLSSEILNNIDILNQSLVGLNERVREIQGLLDAVQQLQQDPQATQTELNEVASTASITALLTRSQNDYDAANTVLNQANELFLSPDCAR